MLINLVFLERPEQQDMLSFEESCTDSF